MSEYLTAENIRAFTPVVTQSATAVLTGITNRIKQAKVKGNKDEIITELDAILTELIEKDNDLIRQVSALQRELDMNFISEEDIHFITENLVPLLEKVIKKSSPQKSPEEIEEILDITNSLISTQTLKILQLIGFNFKEAIGKPTTELAREWILSSIKNREIELAFAEQKIELETLQVKQTIMFYEMINDPEAFERYEKFNQIHK